MKKLLLFGFAPLLASCVTLSGTYKLRAVDEAGTDLAPHVNLTAQGSGIYTARNALCINFPGARVVIEDAQTGAALKGESGYRCPKKR
ncbi:hypothetical protein P6166_01485 [Stenotrophomonas sp. HITSZ_GD]|uniref:hypothetical protein n=1 Tax=Stenotrophomonas sp. HITSZ_GD TaxID=3037248 RepID=UPI001028E02D|nr:hypothetical protein [Stenotrophomonas sp. HITSZ_GD]MDG2524035.1 hypothetical protein [Stenotrophomonas sp. HITSZ_GD]